MSGSLQGKVAIVTGASKGIGASIAKALAAEGASVVVNYASSKAGADAVVADIAKAGGKAVAVHGSVAKEAEVKRLFVEADEAFGRLDILVNNAGVYQFGALEDVTEAEYRRQFDTNVLGPILATKEAVKRFPAEGGSVINVSSVASTKGLPGATVYGATKGALDQITRNHAVELAPRKIRVNTIAPGGVETEGTHSRRHHRQRLREADGRRDAARPPRPAGRHRRRGGVPRLRRVALDHRRAPGRRGRLALGREGPSGGDRNQTAARGRRRLHITAPRPRARTRSARSRGSRSWSCGRRRCRA